MTAHAPFDWPCKCVTYRDDEGGATVFRRRKGIKLSYDRQGYIYFTSRSYRRLGAERQAAITALCAEVGGEHSSALFEFVTTDRSPTEICSKYYLSRATLYRAVKRYYEHFPPDL